MSAESSRSSPKSATVSPPANVKASKAGGRPPAFDEEAYKGRNVVERAFALAKQWRGLATRYDKLAVVYRGAVVLCAVITWLKTLGDMP